MARMVRKPFYIEAEQAALLKRIAGERGVSESEVVRECLPGLTARAQQPEVQVLPDPEAWRRADAFIREWIAKSPVPGGRTWRREDLYEE